MPKLSHTAVAPILALVPVERTVSGRDLRAERVRRGLTTHELAARIGVSHQRVTAIEHTTRVTPRSAWRYLSALDLPRVTPEARIAAAVDELLDEARA
jgi:transcriptional regulator with XRE-family HTH domain